MSRISLLSIAVMVVAFGSLVIGCGPGAAPVPEASTIAASAKSQVEKFVENAASAPENAPQECELLLESFTAYAADYGESFAACRDAVMELHLAYKSGSDEATLSEKITALSTAASSLK